MPMLHTENDAEAGAASNGGRGPTVVAAPASVSPELSDRPRRRSFSARDKLRILADIDRAAETRGIGAIPRREGLYSSTLSEWRRQRDAGAFSALVPGKRGPKTAEPNPLAAELARSRKSNADLSRRLARAEAVIDIQKKSRRCWASRWRPPAACLDRRGRGTRPGQRIGRRGPRRARRFTCQRATPARPVDRARACPCEGGGRSPALARGQPGP
jgi:transposase